MSATWNRNVQDFSKRVAGATSVGLNRLFGRRGGGSVGILTYHRIAERVSGVDEPTINVTPARFRQQIEGLLNRGFVGVPLRDVLACHYRGSALPADCFVVTFDDAFESVYSHAWPILQELHVPATAFISTAFLDSDQPFPFDDWGRKNQARVPSEAYRPLTTEQCLEMSASGGMEIGAHTHSHQQFQNRPVEFREDLAQCIDIMRSRFGGQECSFAFPFGRKSLGLAGGELAVAVRESGLTCALTTECEVVDVASDPFDWGRFNVYEWDSARTIQAKLAGWYGWAPKLQERLALKIRHGLQVAPTQKKSDTTRGTAGNGVEGQALRVG